MAPSFRDVIVKIFPNEQKCIHDCTTFFRYSDRFQNGIIQICLT